jgi:hypothetical protein
MHDKVTGMCCPFLERMSAPDVQEFTLEAVNAMLPRLAELVGRQLERRHEIEAKLKELTELVGDLPDPIVLDDADPAPVRAVKKGLLALVQRYQSGWREVESTGAVLKDPRIGLLDFYGRVDGKLVWLCWKYGEPEVTHYHALDEGYSGRKPIANSLKHRLLN